MVKYAPNYFAVLAAKTDATQRKPDVATLFEAIRAAVVVYGAGKIESGEGEGKISLVPRTTPAYVRYAPNYSTVVAATTVTDHPYTMETLATFLGFVQPNGQTTTSFDAAFGALELIDLLEQIRQWWMPPRPRWRWLLEGA